MKLSCDICGGALQMNPGGQKASCTQCGMEYFKERLMEKVNLTTPVVQTPPAEPTRPSMYNLYLKQKFNLFSTYPVEAHVFLDGEQCAILGSKGVVCIPVTEGVHEIVAFTKDTSGIPPMQPVKFEIRGGDVCALLYLRRTVTGVAWVFEQTDRV